MLGEFSVVVANGTARWQRRDQSCSERSEKWLVGHRKSSPSSHDGAGTSPAKSVH